jgi:hypothetical protein
MFIITTVYFDEIRKSLRKAAHMNFRWRRHFTEHSLLNTRVC